MDAHEILLMVEFAIVVGIVGYVIADQIKIPAIVLLMFLGILFGPQVLDLVDPRELGAGLQVVVSIAVGIIVFEGGLLLDFQDMRNSTPAIRNLITVGVAVSVVGGTLAAYFIAGLPLALAALYGALMSVTGPTVVTPLLKRAKVNRRLNTILQSEAVLIDAIGAILAVVVLNILVENPSGVVFETAEGIVARLSVGVTVGLLGGFFIANILQRLNNLPAGTVRLAALGGALAIFDLAELFATESGIAAVALAGIVIGNMKVPFFSQIKRFKGDLTNLGIILLFVLLAAGLDLQTFTAFNGGVWGGVATVLIMMVLVRPAGVFLSTMGTNLAFKEKLYIAALGPRGVVAAAIALFAEIELMNIGYPGVEGFVGLVFMTIIGTVVIQGLAAAPLARLLGVRAMQVIIISADNIGRALARRLEENGSAVTLIDTDISQVEKARKAGLDARHGDGTDGGDLRQAGIDEVARFVAATSSDRTNLLACQLAMEKFGVKHVVARVNNPDNLDNFSSLGIHVVSPVQSTAMLLDNLVRRPAATELITSQTPGQKLLEATLNNQRFVNRPLKDWELDSDVLVIMARRGDELFVVHGDTRLQKGDVVTLIGASEDVERTAEVVEGMRR